MAISRPDAVESRILKALDGSEDSFLEISVGDDGSVILYEAYSGDAGQRLARELRKLGVRLTVVQSSPCG